jgi:hypothetical protein
LEAHYHGRRNGAQGLKQQRASDRARKANAQDALTRAVVVDGTRAVVDGSGVDAPVNQAGGKSKDRMKQATRVEWNERLDADEEKLIEAIDTAAAEDVLHRIRAFRGR